MSGTMVVIGVIFQIAFAGMQAMMAIFAGAGLANSRNLPDWILTSLMQCIWILPLISLTVAGLLIYFHVTKSPLQSYGWHAIPVAAFVVYMLLLQWLWN